MLRCVVRRRGGSGTEAWSQMPQDHSQRALFIGRYRTPASVCAERTTANRWRDNTFVNIWHDDEPGHGPWAEGREAQSRKCWSSSLESEAVASWLPQMLAEYYAITQYERKSKYTVTGYWAVSALSSAVSWLGFKVTGNALRKLEQPVLQISVAANHHEMPSGSAETHEHPTRCTLKGIFRKGKLPSATYVLEFVDWIEKLVMSQLCFLQTWVTINVWFNMKMDIVPGAFKEGIYVWMVD